MPFGPVLPYDIFIKLLNNLLRCKGCYVVTHEYGSITETSPNKAEFIDKFTVKLFARLNLSESP